MTSKTWKCKACDYCVKKGSSKHAFKKLAVHVKWEHPEYLICKSCLKMFASKAEAKTHCEAPTRHNMPKLASYYVPDNIAEEGREDQ